MTITEVEEFYNQDQRKYEVVHNRELLNWLKKKIKNGLSNKFQASVFLFYVTMYRAVGLKSRLAAKSFISHR